MEGGVGTESVTKSISGADSTSMDVCDVLLDTPSWKHKLRFDHLLNLVN